MILFFFSCASSVRQVGVSQNISHYSMFTCRRNLNVYYDKFKMAKLCRIDLLSSSYCNMNRNTLSAWLILWFLFVLWSRTNNIVLFLIFLFFYRRWLTLLGILVHNSSRSFSAMVRGVCVCVLCLSIMMLRNFSGLFGVSLSFSIWWFLQ